MGYTDVFPYVNGLYCGCCGECGVHLITVAISKELVRGSSITVYGLRMVKMLFYPCGMVLMVVVIVVFFILTVMELLSTMTSTIKRLYFSILIVSLELLEGVLNIKIDRWLSPRNIQLN